MDIDLDFDHSDHISEFLRSKLNEIKSENSQLKASLRHREETASKLGREISKNSTNPSVKISRIWKKLVNGKYVLGLELRNENESKLSDVKTVLNWTAPSPFTYKSHVQKGLFTDITNFDDIYIIFDCPSFTDSLTYAISGFISFKQDDKNYLLNLPSKIELTPGDVTDNSVKVHFYKVIEGSKDSFLAAALSCYKQEYVMISDSNYVENIFEIDCSFTKIKITSQNSYFLGHKICPELDGVILEVLKNEDSHQGVFFNVYFKDFETVLSLLHYLHRCIIDVVIVPKSHYQPDLSLGELAELLRKSLREEIEMLEQGSKGDLEQLRRKVAELEQQSDVLVARINEIQKC